MKAKKRISGFVAIIIASILLVSCNSNNDILSHFSKRKYLNKFNEKYIKHEDKEIEILSENSANLITSINKMGNELVGEINTIMPVNSNPSQYNVVIDTEKIKKNETGFSDWSRYNRNFIYHNINTNYRDNYVPDKVEESAHWTNVVALVTGIIGVPIIAVVFGAIGVFSKKPGKWMGIVGMILGLFWMGLFIYFLFIT